jgi:hypothetical protein
MVKICQCLKWMVPKIGGCFFDNVLTQQILQEIYKITLFLKLNGANRVSTRTTSRNIYKMCTLNFLECVLFVVGV